MRRHFNVIVVGGGHAGIEAAWAAARMGAETAMVTMSREAIGRMSCNPAIGGVGKGQMVREIDALGGLMGLSADRAGIQFRLLNRSKGPAVWAPRAQADRHGYPHVVQSLLGEARSLSIVEGIVEEIETRPAVMAGRSAVASDRRCVGSIRLQDGRVFGTEALILTTGTFLRGLMHCGTQQTEGGRVGEASAAGLSAALKGLGFALGRLKTGTPPRVHRDTIDYDACELQQGDDVPVPFSFMTDGITQRQINCWITWTNEDVHELILANLHRAPMYSGQIQSTGPRYCPSIEDKVVRFSDKPRHQVFLEPEGYDNERVYCNGISTSLPREVQDEILRDILGLRGAKILQHGYAVEYDFVPTRQTKPTLETKLIEGLFLAGQINGTSGYEEAAAQGIIAGINAVRRLRGQEPVVLGRQEAYIGVMIDDLVTRPPTDPYRMFTSRAEYRLRLRADNADQRLTPLGRDLGLVDDIRWQRFEAERDASEMLRCVCAKASFGGLPLATWMRRPEADVSRFAEAVGAASDRTFCANVLWRALVAAKYAGYETRHERQIERFERLESLAIPAFVDYAAMPELRHEAREKLAQIAPRTLGQAARVSGITPADMTILWVYLSGRRPVAAADKPHVSVRPS